MVLNNYLRIKKASDGTLTSNMQPGMAQRSLLKSLYGIPLDSVVPYEYREKSPNVRRLDAMYDKLVPEGSNLRVEAATFRSDDGYNWTRKLRDKNNPKATMALRPFNLLGDDANIFSYLHERGHVNDWEKTPHNSQHIRDWYSPKYNDPEQPMHSVLQSIGNFGHRALGIRNPLQDLTYKKLLGTNIYSSRAMRGALERERKATQYAYDVLSTIKDPVVRERALKDAREQLEASYDTYASMYKPLLKYNNIGGTIGALGLGAGLGYYGYRGGDRFADYMKWTGKKRWLARAAGALGLGALGAYGGAHLGSIGGQMYFNKYKSDAAWNAYDNAIARVEDADRRFSENSAYLTDYLNGLQTTNRGTNS